MKTPFLLSVLILLCVASMLTACGGSEEHHEDGDDHDHASHADNEPSSAAESGHGEADEHGHADTTLGPVVIAGRTLSITLHGPVNAGSSIHADITASGEPFDALRAWIGNETGEGSLKAKAAGTGPVYHIDLEAPANMDDSTAVWLEIQNSGKKSTSSVPIK